MLSVLSKVFFICYMSSFLSKKLIMDYEKLNSLDSFDKLVHSPLSLSLVLSPKLNHGYKFSCLWLKKNDKI